MKSIAVIIGLFAAAALSAPLSQLIAKDVESDAFDYTNNINNKVDVKDVTPDLFDYHNNIDNGVVVDDVDGKSNTRT